MQFIWKTVDAPIEIRCKQKTASGWTTKIYNWNWLLTVWRSLNDARCPRGEVITTAYTVICDCSWTDNTYTIVDCVSKSTNGFWCAQWSDAAHRNHCMCQICAWSQLPQLFCFTLLLISPGFSVRSLISPWNLCLFIDTTVLTKRSTKLPVHFSDALCQTRLFSTQGRH